MNERAVSSEPGAACSRGPGRYSPRGLVAAMEWPTVILIVACTGCIVWICVTADRLPLAASIGLLAIALALHSSLQHEVLHGHPSRSVRFNEALVFVPFGLFIPYQRFRDLHLLHHVDERLTDPYDDPESNYFDPDHWWRLSGISRAVLNFNNTLLGRMVIGPLFGLMVFFGQDLRAMSCGDRTVSKAYGLHVLALLPWLWWLHAQATLPLWAYTIAAYLALSLLKVRTYLEHRAHRDVQARTAIVEDRGFFAWLFLNNNLHLVHHRHPRAPWYRLPALYRARRSRFLECNQGYVYSSYRAVFAAHWMHRKDPVPHPILRHRLASDQDDSHPPEAPFP